MECETADNEAAWRRDSAPTGSTNPDYEAEMTPVCEEDITQDDARVLRAITPADGQLYMENAADIVSEEEQLPSSAADHAGLARMEAQFVPRADRLKERAKLTPIRWTPKNPKMIPLRRSFHRRSQSERTFCEEVTVRLLSAARPL